MNEKQQKIAKLFTVMGIILMFIAVVALIYNIISLAVLNGRKASMERYSQELQAQIDDKSEEIDYKSSKDYVERFARDYLNMKYKDEGVYEGTSSSGTDNNEEK